MPKLFWAPVAALALSTLCLAQSAPASPTNNGASTAAPAQTQSPAAAVPRIAPGSVIPVQLTTTVDAKKAKTGEQVTAKVTQDLKANNGMMLMPKDTEIVGHITEAQARNKQDKESQVGIIFDHAVMKNSDISYPLSIQAVISPQVFQHPNNQNNGGGPGATEAPSTAQAPMPGGSAGAGNAGRGMGSGQTEPPNAPSSEASSDTSSNGASSNGSHAPAITGQTQGVVGFSHLKLDTPSSPTQASVLSSEKNNVKLENGTLMLLRVNQ